MLSKWLGCGCEQQIHYLGGWSEWIALKRLLHLLGRVYTRECRTAHRLTILPTVWAFAISRHTTLEFNGNLCLRNIRMLLLTAGYYIRFLYFLQTYCAATSDNNKESTEKFQMNYIQYYNILCRFVRLKDFRKLWQSREL